MGMRKQEVDDLNKEFPELDSNLMSLLLGGCSDNEAKECPAHRISREVTTLQKLGVPAEQTAMALVAQLGSMLAHSLDATGDNTEDNLIRILTQFSKYIQVAVQVERNNIIAADTAKRIKDKILQVVTESEQDHDTVH